MTEAAIVDDDTLEQPTEAPEEAPTETPESPVEGAEESPPIETPEAVTFNEQQQEKLNKIIDKTTARHGEKLREIQEEKDRIARELEETRAKLPQEVAPEIPPLPDPFDDNYEQQLAERDEMIRLRAQWDTDQQRKIEAEQQQQYLAEQQQIETANNAVRSYTAQAEKLGVKDEELKAAATQIGTYGIDPLVSALIIQDEHGPLITTYLAKHPEKLAELNQMPSVLAVAHVAASIKPEAVASRKVVDDTPPPQDKPEGGTFPASKDGPAGATYT